MQPYSDYEIAQRRIAERQRKKTQFRISLAFLVILIFITVVSSSSGACTFPLSIIAVIFIVANGIELYYSTPKHTPDMTELEQEIKWLFEDDWQNQVSTQALAFAQDRIRKRRINKWGFVEHLLLFVPINGWLIFTAMRNQYSPQGFVLLVILSWSIIFINHARIAFPTKSMLAKREINLGKTLQIELAHLQPEKIKAREKLKRGKYYEVGDDGELVEVEDEIMQLGEKPKREASDG